MKQITFSVPTFTDVRQASRSARGSMSRQLAKLAKKVEPKPAKAKKVAK